MRLPAPPLRHQHDAEILRLAVPAFGALVAEPLFLLADSAIVGHLGTPQLAGVGVAATILGTVLSLCVFLAYGTTSTVARMIGAGNESGALRRGIDGLWLALIVGVILAGLGTVFAPELVGLFDANADASEFGVTYLRISAIGLPGMLAVLAMTGVLRGMQDTRTPLLVAAVAAVANVILNLVFVYGFGMGVGGCALGTVLAQWGSALAYIAVVLRGARGVDVSFAPHWLGVLGGLTASAPLLIRTVSLRVVLILMAAIAARLGEEQLAAHQVTTTIWTALGLGLDAVAIAGQALVGRYLGGGDVRGARQATQRMVEWAIGAGIVFGLLIFLTRSLLPPLFTSDEAVREQLETVLIVIAVILPVTGWAFALDGVLIGAGDARFLAVGQAVTLIVFIPAIALVIALDGGLNAVWWAYGIWMVGRTVMLVWRERGDQWAVVGATR
ncbi:MAG: MATE family efflux transporter [Dehalococcoidia bacterium]